MALEKAMKILVQAEKERKAAGPISDLFEHELSLEDAHAVCERNVQKRINQGEKIAGYKVGFTNIPLREKMGIPDSTYGYILDSMILESGAEVRSSELIDPKIECEICFKLGRDLSGKDIPVEDVLAATDVVTGSFEICDARIKDWKCPFPDILADNGFAGRIVLPGSWHPARQVDLPGETAALIQDGKQVAEGKGELSMGHPARTVSWLAGKLAERGKGLKAGQIVMTGTLTAIRPMEKGATYEAKFSTLGQVRVTFV